MPVYRLGDLPVFPPPDGADEHGLVAIGGDLRPERLIRAYASGIFPWPHDGYPLLWFSPDPRFVLPLDALHVPRRLRRTMRTGRFGCTLDTAFEDVIQGCAEAPRPGQDGTWITADIRRAFARLHRMGHAHSVEVWRNGRLAGGLYGVALGALFVGESMFSRDRDASKVALVTVVRQIERFGFDLFDAQVRTEHVARFGAREWPRSRYLAELPDRLNRPGRVGRWVLDPDLSGDGRHLPGSSSRESL